MQVAGLKQMQLSSLSLMVQGIVDSLLIQTGLLRVSPCPCLFRFERRFGKWLTREIHIWVWFSINKWVQSVLAWAWALVQRGQSHCSHGRGRTQSPLPVLSHPQLQVELPHPSVLHLVQEPWPSNPGESPEGNTLIDFETVTVKWLIKPG